MSRRTITNHAQLTCDTMTPKYSDIYIAVMFLLCGRIDMCFMCYTVPRHAGSSPVLWYTNLPVWAEYVYVWVTPMHMHVYGIHRCIHPIHDYLIGQYHMHAFATYIVACGLDLSWHHWYMSDTAWKLNYRRL